jgi:hypothetical protein
VQYEYYDLPFCKQGKSRSRAENLGERIAGDTVTNSPYEVRSNLFKLLIYLVLNKVSNSIAENEE